MTTPTEPTDSELIAALAAADQRIAELEAAEHEATDTDTTEPTP